MRKSTKYIITTAAVTAMLLGCVSVSYASSTASKKTGWEQITVEGEKEWVYYKSGRMVKSDWVCSPASGLWYYMDEDGYMLSDCWGDDRNSDGYWFDENGVMATGWRLIELEDDKDVSYGPGYDTNKDKKGYFYFDSSGMVWEGWLNLGGTYYYMNDGYVEGFEDYQMVYGSVEIDDKEYYFGEDYDGSMKKGMVKTKIEENENAPGATTTELYCLYGDDGVRVVDGWGKYNNEWYYSDKKGQVVTDGFLYLDEDDDMVDEKDADYIYYMNEKGIMAKGWLELSDDTGVKPGQVKTKRYFYFKPNGAMWTGWLKENNSYYYMSLATEGDYAKGEMVTGIQKIVDTTYYFGDDGKMEESTWITVEDTTGKEHNIYLDSKGAMVQGKGPGDLAYATIKSSLYFFDGNGYCIEDKGTIIVEKEGKWMVYEGDESSLPANSRYYKIKSKGVAELQKKS